MRALTVTPSTGEFAVRDVPMPILEADEVLVRITRVAFTRRDRLIMENPKAVSPEGSKYLIPGHIAAGRVAETGSLVKNLAAGDLVVPTIRRDCDKCIDARSDICPHPDKYMDSGLMRAHGFAREFIVLKSRYLINLPDDLENLALLLTPLSVAEKAHREAVQILERYNFYCFHNDDPFPPRTLVTGMGLVGIMAAFLLSLYNYRITVFGRRESDDSRSAVLDPLDVEFINTARVPLERLEKTRYHFNHIFETTGDPSYIMRTIPFMGFNAIMVLMGIPENIAGETHLDIEGTALFSRMIEGNQILMGSLKAGRDAFNSSVKHLIELSDLYGKQLAGLITHTFPLEEYRKVLALDSREAILPVLDLT
ncbi:MAG: alcohol dehydrogenase catalytic domain-containing protein [Deltaproteobacteria bacterium]|nr:alcohol dehydrogenase catalytic domain-containing protein [Deltaproteobacteria bacterium]